ncbi:MAG: hypothetical protein JWM28_2678, partial [Chitinophagaceae bacterium]|nr:hypothetical protein [Chitinophagaceae bacterium]
MKKILIFIILLNVYISSQKVNAQGCVAVRQMGGENALGTGSYNLSKGDFQIGGNYRYFHSWRHFVGREEQPQRQNTGGGIGADGKDHGNAVNIYSHALDLNLSYGLTSRIQLYVSVPYVHNERSQVLRQTLPVVDTFRYSVFAKGLGDVRLGANYWIFDPAKAQKGNLSVGLGIKLPTGSHSKTDQAPQANGTKRIAVMDQAIQPGDGGLGISVEIQGFRQLYRSIYVFANGYYLFNPKESNGTFKSAPKAGLEGYNIYACPDQYFGRAGFMTSVLKDKSLTFSLAGRFEGIPAYDAFGGQVAYRRPGYVVAIESGISYRSGQHSLSLFVPYNFIKNRIQSAADIADQKLQNESITDPTKAVHVQGD